MNKRIYTKFYITEDSKKAHIDLDSAANAVINDLNICKDKRDNIFYYSIKTKKFSNCFNVENNKKSVLHNMLSLIWFVSIDNEKLTKQLTVNEISKVITLIMYSAKYKEEAPAYKIFFKNGFFDTNEKKFYYMEEKKVNYRKYFMTNVNDFEFNIKEDKTAKKEVEKYLKTLTCGNADEEHNILSASALCFLRSNNNNKFINFFGEGGCGKSTYIKIIQSIIGVDNYSTLTPQSLAVDRFASYFLFGKTANFLDDYKIDVMKEDTTAKLKQLSGDGMINAEIKNGQMFSFSSNAQNIFLSNRMMKFVNTDFAILRRMIPIKFSANFVKNNTDDFRFAEKVTYSFKNELLKMILGKIKKDGLVEFKKVIYKNEKEMTPVGISENESVPF